MTRTYLGKHPHAGTPCPATRIEVRLTKEEAEALLLVIPIVKKHENHAMHTARNKLLGAATMEWGVHGEHARKENA